MFCTWLVIFVWFHSFRRSKMYLRLRLDVHWYSVRRQQTRFTRTTLGMLLSPSTLNTRHHYSLIRSEQTYGACLRHASHIQPRQMPNGRIHRIHVLHRLSTLWICWVLWAKGQHTFSLRTLKVRCILAESRANDCSWIQSAQWFQSHPRMGYVFIRSTWNIWNPVHLGSHFDLSYCSFYALVMPSTVESAVASSDTYIDIQCFNEQAFEGNRRSATLTCSAGFVNSDGHSLLLKTLTALDYTYQQFVISPNQFGIPYLRPRWDSGCVLWMQLTPPLVLHLLLRCRNEFQGCARDSCSSCLV